MGPTGATGPQGPAGTNGTNGAAGPTWMSWSWSRGADVPHILAGGNAAFRAAASVIYPGTAVVAVPGFVKVLTDGLGAPPNFDIQLYDTTNSQILAQILNQSNTTPVISSLSITPANWPVGVAHLELRIRDNNAALDQILLYGMTWHN